MLALRKAENFTSKNIYPFKSVSKMPVIIGALVLSEVTARVTAHGVPLILRPIEFQLLKCLMLQPERVYSRVELLQQAWGRRVVVGECTVDVHIRRLRMSLEPFGMAAWIRTYPTRGYYFSTSY